MNDRLGSLSHHTCEPSTLINLYSNASPAVMLTMADHVFADLVNAIAADGLQLPSSEIEPTSLMTWPASGTATSSKVTGTLVPAPQVSWGEELVLELGDAEVELTGADELVVFGEVPPPEPPVMAMSAQDR